jgi:hypothetical protein
MKMKKRIERLGFIYKEKGFDRWSRVSWYRTNTRTALPRGVVLQRRPAGAWQQTIKESSKGNLPL